MAEAEELKPTEVKQGPCVANLDVTLKHLKVDRKAYHGGAFVGNHVNKLLKVKLD